MKSCLSEILSRDLPTYLHHKLLRFGTKAGLWNNLQPMSPERLAHVYDIKNTGPRNRFTVLGNNAFIVHNCGHDAFLLYLSLLSDKLNTHSVPYKPYIWDLHDAVMLTVPEDCVEEAVHILDVVAMDELNARLGGTIRLKGVTNVVNNWAEDKE